MITTALSTILTALLAVISRIAGQKILEQILTAILVWGLPRLAAMTTNRLDDALAQTVIDALTTQQQDAPK